MTLSKTLLTAFIILTGTMLLVTSCESKKYNRVKEGTAERTIKTLSYDSLNRVDEEVTEYFGVSGHVFEDVTVKSDYIKVNTGDKTFDSKTTTVWLGTDTVFVELNKNSVRKFSSSVTKKSPSSKKVIVTFNGEKVSETVTNIPSSENYSLEVDDLSIQSSKSVIFVK